MEYIRFVVSGFFFFQAEDGIRDLVRSRGLGDVYKRQGLPSRPDLSVTRYSVMRSTRLMGRPQLWAMSVALDAQGDTVPKLSLIHI